MPPVFTFTLTFTAENLASSLLCGGNTPAVCATCSLDNEDVDEVLDEEVEEEEDVREEEAEEILWWDVCEEEE